MVNSKVVEHKHPPELKNLESYSFCYDLYFCVICLLANLAITAPSCQLKCGSIVLLNYLF